MPKWPPSLCHSSSPELQTDQRFTQCKEGPGGPPQRKYTHMHARAYTRGGSSGSKSLHSRPCGLPQLPATSFLAPWTPVPRAAAVGMPQGLMRAAAKPYLAPQAMMLQGCPSLQAHSAWLGPGALHLRLSRDLCNSLQPAMEAVPRHCLISAAGTSGENCPASAVWAVYCFNIRLKNKTSGRSGYKRQPPRNRYMPTPTYRHRHTRTHAHKAAVTTEA